MKLKLRMTEFKISTIATPAKIDLLYRKIEEQGSVETTLILPSYLQKYRFGLLSDILKLVINLNSYSRISIVKINLEEDELDKFFDQEYSYPVLALLWNIASFVDKNDKNIKQVLRQKQNEFYLNMNSFSNIKGNKYLLVNTDHLPKEKGLIKLLENTNGFNDDEEKITNKISKVLSDYVLTFNKKNLQEIQPIIKDIGAIIYELVKNTYEWGRTDTNNVTVSPSIRGAYLRYHIGKNENVIDEFKNTPLEEFFRNPILLEKSANKSNQIYYLEILVFDSGIGFVDKFGKNNKDSDIDIIKKCLIKNQTSSTTNMKTKKGKGLDRILGILDGKGFLKITTDKYCLYRDLLKDEYKPIDKNNLDGLILNHWDNQNQGTTNSRKVQGSYISILYPFNN